MLINITLVPDAELQLQNPLAWLEDQLHKHSSWIWLNPPTLAGNPKAHAVIAWAKQQGVKVQILSNPHKDEWWSDLKK